MSRILTVFIFIVACSILGVAQDANELPSAPSAVLKERNKPSQPAAEALQAELTAAGGEVICLRAEIRTTMPTPPISPPMLPKSSETNGFPAHLADAGRPGRSAPLQSKAR